MAKLLVQYGTTTVADGFDGPGTVAGRDGLEFAKGKRADAAVFLIPALSHTQMGVVGQFAAFDDSLDALGCGSPMPLCSLEFHRFPYPETPGLRIPDHGMFHVGMREQGGLFV